MTKFVKVINNKVIDIIVADQAHINTLSDKDFYIEDNGTKFINEAGIGYSYDAVRGAFIPPKSFPSWILNENTCIWEAPVASPYDEENSRWNEETTSWEKLR